MDWKSDSFSYRAHLPFDSKVAALPSRASSLGASSPRATEQLRGPRVRLIVPRATDRAQFEPASECAWCGKPSRICPQCTAPSFGSASAILRAVLRSVILW
jgi:ferredoxin